MIADKIVSREEAKKRVQAWKAAGEKIIFANGCFDLLHAGHVRYLEQAKALGDRLIVAVNEDASVTALKGPTRPIQPIAERAAILAALESVDLVVPFAEERTVKLLEVLHPDVLVKGGDYTIDQLPAVETNYVKSYGGEVKLVPLLGPSTTELIQRIKEA
jgi:D-beta-D-heptose 7-phosphate kinase / D-beta-D-heptose 1-phosphate adenosyltransferase